VRYREAQAEACRSAVIAGGTVRFLDDRASREVPSAIRAAACLMHLIE